ncbi:MAG: hypothetical protein JWP92_71 [Caulobacter sp.]|nr:hypothetical protein [Caulobacter sp.]
MSKNYRIEIFARNSDLRPRFTQLFNGTLEAATAEANKMGRNFSRARVVPLGD